MFRIPQDVVTRKTIRRILVPERRGHGRLDFPVTGLNDNEYINEGNITVVNALNNPNRKKKNYLIWVVGGVCSIFLLFVAFGMWTKAYVEVVPKNELVSFNIPFNYSLNRKTVEGDSATHLAELISTSKKVSRQIGATRTENIKRKTRR